MYKQKDQIRQNATTLKCTHDKIESQENSTNGKSSIVNVVLSQTTNITHTGSTTIDTHVCHSL